jgi:Phage tail tube protein
LTVELVTKNLGKLFEAALGSGVSTLIAGSAYQQLFTPTTTDSLPSYTIQVGIPPIGGGAISPQTYQGMVCSGFEISAQNNAIPTAKFDFAGVTMVTATGAITPAYPTGVEIFSFIHGAIKVGTAALTVPTTTALASGSTSVADIRDFDMTWDNGLDSDGFNFGGAGKRSRKQVLGVRGLTGTVTAEYDNDTLRDAFRNQTDLSLVLTFATTTLISGSSFPTLQIVVPNIRLEGEMPKASGGAPISQSISFTALDNAVASAQLYVAIVTSETAI